MTPPARWFRTHPHSALLEQPRLLARLLIPRSELDQTIVSYTELLGTQPDLRMPIPDFGGLELCAIGGLLVIASERPFLPVQRETRFSLVVPHLLAQIRKTCDAGAALVEPVERILPGARARLRYPDGTLAELVEHRPLTGERSADPVRAPDLTLLPRWTVSPERFISMVQFAAVAFGAQIPALPVETPPSGWRVVVGGVLVVAHEATDGSTPSDAEAAVTIVIDADYDTARIRRPPNMRLSSTHAPIELPGGLRGEVRLRSELITTGHATV